MAIQNICVFSGKRGGFGAYVPLMNLIEADPELNLQILLGDMHASKEFGSTVEEARKLYPKTTLEIIEMGAGRGDTPRQRAENLGTCLEKTPGILERLKPDVMMVHGDRGEHLVVALAALNLGLPITHSQGGDVSGNIDDIQRHAIMKLAHIHFPETEDSAERIKKLGEEPSRIHVVGSLYIDRIVKKMYTPFADIQKKYGLKEGEHYFIILLHPDTFETRDENQRIMENTLTAVRETGKRAFIIYPCSDPGYEGILKAIEGIASDPQFMIYKNIENLDFLSLMSGADALIGNSSSALVEAPYFQLPALNIGNRQMDRDREENVVDAKGTKEDIARKLTFVLTDDVFRKKLATCGTRLGDGHASEKILEVVKNLTVDKKLLQKRITY